MRIIIFFLLVFHLAVQSAYAESVTVSATPASPITANSASPNVTTEQPMNSSNASPAAPSVTSVANKVAIDKPNKPTLEDKLVIIGTGAVTGVYYPAGGALCRLINKERKKLGIRCAVESTPGSVYNLETLKASEIDFAIVQSDWQEHAYNGTGIFAQKGRFEKLRFMFSLHNEAITVIVPKSSAIEKFDDLKGKIVNIGPEGSGARATMGDIMKAKGWTKYDFKGLSELRSAEQPKALCNGTVDAIVLATGHPNGLVNEISKTCAIKIINVDDPIIQKFMAGNPEFAPTIIPGKLYKGIDNNINTFGVKATFVTTSDMSDELVYNMTKVLFENLEEFKPLHPVFQQLDAAKMPVEGQIAPYHNGALRYFKEKGLVDK